MRADGVALDLAKLNGRRAKGRPFAGDASKVSGRRVRYGFKAGAGFNGSWAVLG